MRAVSDDEENVSKVLEILHISKFLILFYIFNDIGHFFEARELHIALDNIPTLIIGLREPPYKNYVPHIDRNRSNNNVINDHVQL